MSRASRPNHDISLLLVEPGRLARVQRQGIGADDALGYDG